MYYSVLKKAMELSLVIVLVACSNDRRYKRQVDGDDSYLQTVELKDLRAPVGIILPTKNDNFDVTSVNSKGQLGKQLDIRPPVQTLALINGTYRRFADNIGALIINSRTSIWSDVFSVVKEKQYPVADLQNEHQSLSTDWIQWRRTDEDNQYRGRYQLSLQQQGYQQVLLVKLLELQQQDKAVTSPEQIQRYTTLMLNEISGAMNQIKASRKDVAEDRSLIDVQSSADDTGLPNFILRAPFDVVWQQLPATLKRIGMSVSNSNRSQGSLHVTYKKPRSAIFSQLGTKDPLLSEGNYKIQVGDLDNRSSLQFLDPKGHLLTQSQTDALVPLLQAVFSKQIK